MDNVKDQIAKSLGKDYARALDKVMSIRKERQSNYGDSFMEDRTVFLFCQMENKLKRFKMQMNVKGNIDDVEYKDKEKAIDSLVDLCNYALFLIAKETQNEEK